MVQSRTRDMQNIRNREGERQVDLEANHPVDEENRDESMEHRELSLETLNKEKPTTAHIEENTESTFISPPPDGGRTAWLQVLTAHIVIFNTWGYINSFGLFQTYYVSTLSRSPSDISWIGSIQVFLLFFIGTLSGRGADAGYFRTLFAAGLFMQLLGVFMTSLCTSYWQLFLSQGICTGLGNGLLFCPSLSVLSTYFKEKRAQAIGIAACGTATGGIVFPLIAQQLLPKVGFGWTVRIMGFLMLATMSFPLAFSRTRLPPRQTGPLVEWSAFKELPYLLYAIGITLCFWGLYFAYYYVSFLVVQLSLFWHCFLTGCRSVHMASRSWARPSKNLSLFS